MIMENYFNQLNQFAKQMQQPFQQMMDLNLKTLKSLQTFDTEHLKKMDRPEMLVERQVEIMIDAGHKLLDYAEQSFEISEKAFLNFFKTFGHSESHLKNISEGNRSAFDRAIATMNQFNPMAVWERSKEALDPSLMESMDPTKIMREVSESLTVPKYDKPRTVEVQEARNSGLGKEPVSKTSKKNEKISDKKAKH